MGDRFAHGGEREIAVDVLPLLFLRIAVENRKPALISIHTRLNDVLIGKEGEGGERCQHRQNRPYAFLHREQRTHHLQPGRVNGDGDKRRENRQPDRQ